MDIHTIKIHQEIAVLWTCGSFGNVVRSSYFGGYGYSRPSPHLMKPGDSDLLLPKECPDHLSLCPLNPKEAAFLYGLLLCAMAPVPQLKPQRLRGCYAAMPCHGGVELKWSNMLQWSDTILHHLCLDMFFRTQLHVMTHDPLCSACPFPGCKVKDASHQKPCFWQAHKKKPSMAWLIWLADSLRSQPSGQCLKAK